MADKLKDGLAITSNMYTKKTYENGLRKQANTILQPLNILRSDDLNSQTFITFINKLQGTQLKQLLNLLTDTFIKSYRQHYKDKIVIGTSRWERDDAFLVRLTAILKILPEVRAILRNKQKEDKAIGTEDKIIDRLDNFSKILHDFVQVALKDKQDDTSENIASIIKVITDIHKVVKLVKRQEAKVLEDKKEKQDKLDSMLQQHQKQREQMVAAAKEDLRKEEQRLKDQQEQQVIINKKQEHELEQKLVEENHRKQLVAEAAAKEDLCKEEQRLKEEQQRQQAIEKEWLQELAEHCNSLEEEYIAKIGAEIFDEIMGQAEQDPTNTGATTVLEILTKLQEKIDIAKRVNEKTEEIKGTSPKIQYILKKDVENPDNKEFIANQIKKTFTEALAGICEQVSWLLQQAVEQNQPLVEEAAKPQTQVGNAILNQYSIANKITSVVTPNVPVVEHNKELDSNNLQIN